MRERKSSPKSSVVPSPVQGLRRDGTKRNKRIVKELLLNSGFQSLHQLRSLPLLSLFLSRLRVEPVKPAKPARRKPMVKEFGKAHSYAEKRLAEAIKERAEFMAKVAMLNAEIPSLVQIIKALGATPNLTGMQDYSAQMPMIPNPAYQQPQYPSAPPTYIPLASETQLGAMPIAPRAEQ